VIEAADTEPAVVRKPVKSEAAFRTISEVSEDLEVPQHVLRFWESKFPQIKPLKRGGGRRYYRPEDLQLLKRIRDLLYKDGYTIRGVQKLLRDQTRGQGNGEVKPEAASAKEPPAAAVADTPIPAAAKPAIVQAELRLETAAGSDRLGSARAELQSLLGELEELRSLLAKARQD
jgi:DNA-binding transcriptional MerR regulator